MAEGSTGGACTKAADTSERASFPASQDRSAGLTGPAAKGPQRVARTSLRPRRRDPGEAPPDAPSGYQASATIATGSLMPGSRASAGPTALATRASRAVGSLARISSPTARAAILAATWTATPP